MSIMIRFFKLSWSHSVVSDSLWPPWTVAHQAPLSVGILQAKKHWNGLPCPAPENPPKLGIEPALLAGGFFTTSATWEADTCN